jgi:DNA-directed RNA polymerase subunit RPC12/RpoP
MRKLTKKERAAYLKAGGVKCPYCGSDDIKGGFIEVIWESAYQPVRCLACDKRWTDVYTLTRIDEEGQA